MRKEDIYKRQYQLALIKLNESRINLIERPEDEEEVATTQEKSSSGGIINTIQNVVDVGTGVMSLIPGLNVIAAGIDAASGGVDFLQGEYGDGALRLASGALGIVPGAGAATKAVGTAAKVAKAADTVSDVSKVAKGAESLAPIATTTARLTDTATGVAKEIPAEVLGSTNTASKIIGQTPGGAIDKMIGGQGAREFGVGLRSPATTTRPSPSNLTKTADNLPVPAPRPNDNLPAPRPIPDARRIPRTDTVPSSTQTNITRSLLKANAGDDEGDGEEQQAPKQIEKPTDLTVNKYKVGQFELGNPTKYTRSVVRDLTPDAAQERESMRRQRSQSLSPQYESKNFPMAMQYDWDEDDEKEKKSKVKSKEIETIRVKPGVFELPAIDRDHPYISAFKHREDSFEGAKRRQRGISHYFRKPTLDIATDYARSMESIRQGIPESTDIMNNKDYELYNKVKSSVSRYLRSKEGKELDSHLKTIKRDLT